MRKVSSWTRILNVSLLCIRSIQLISPEVNSVSCAIKLVLVASCTLLTKIRVFSRWIACIECSSCLSEHLVVVSGSWLVSIPLLFILAVWYFRKEIARVSLGIKCSFCFFVDRFILARAWVQLIGQPSVFDINRWFEKLSLVFRCLEIANWCM